MAIQTKNSKAPSHEIFHVVGEGEKARWTKLGVAWAHNDGAGLNLIMNYTPLVAGNTVVRKITPKKKEA